MAEAARTATFLPLADLARAYRAGDLSPLDVARAALARIEAHDPDLGAFLCRTTDLALEQAAAAGRALRGGARAPLLGVPVALKDTYAVAGYPTTYGSLAYRDHVPDHDSGLVRRLKAAGAVLVGKTNTAEFGQSATTDNRLGGDCRNPWDLGRTPGGSSGGSAAAVAAGLANVAVGADGGGSVRIPAAFTGLVGVKPTVDLCPDEGGARAFAGFLCPGPLARCVDDARRLLGVLCDREMAPGEVTRLRVAWCARPEGRPVDAGVADACARAVDRVAGLGHEVVPVDLPLGGWQEIFGPLVLEDEHRERGHLLDDAAGLLTDYERATLEAGRALDPAAPGAARAALPGYRARIDALFESFDLLALPATAVPAFPLGRRPREVGGEPVDVLWGAVPFTAPFNLGGNPAASLPCGLAGGLPVGLQLVAARGADARLLDAAEQIETALDFDAGALRARWTP